MFALLVLGAATLALIGTAFWALFQPDPKHPEVLVWRGSRFRTWFSFATAGAEMRELPMAEGRGGLLGAWFTALPSADAVPLSITRADGLKNRALMTGRLAAYALTLV